MKRWKRRNFAGVLVVVWIHRQRHGHNNGASHLRRVGGILPDDARPGNILIGPRCVRGTPSRRRRQSRLCFGRNRILGTWHLGAVQPSRLPKFMRNIPHYCVCSSATLVVLARVICFQLSTTPFALLWSMDLGEHVLSDESNMKVYHHPFWERSCVI